MSKIIESEKVELKGYVDVRLRRLVEEYADRENIPLSECVAFFIAKGMRRPDLAGVPRKKIGRRRKDQMPADASV